MKVMINSKGFGLKQMCIMALKGICAFSLEENPNESSCSPSGSHANVRVLKKVGGQDLPSFSLGLLCGGTSVSGKPPVLHPSPLQVGDLPDLGR